MFKYWALGPVSPSSDQTDRSGPGEMDLGLYSHHLSALIDAHMVTSGLVLHDCSASAWLDSGLTRSTFRLTGDMDKVSYSIYWVRPVMSMSNILPNVRNRLRSNKYQRF